MADTSMTGVFPVLHIPYEQSGQVDADNLRAQVELNINAGVDGVAVAMGSSVVNLTDAERDSVLKLVVEQVSGRVKTVMNTSAESTDVALDLSRRARDLGADALMVWLPTYFPADADLQVEYFVTVASTVDLPVFIQDQPSSPCPPAMMIRLAGEHENLCYAKVETPPTPPRMAELVDSRAGDLPVIFGGYGGLFVLEEYRRGSLGTFPSAAMPEPFVKTWQLWSQGKEAEAGEEFRRSESLLRLMEMAGPMRFGSVYREMLMMRGLAKSPLNRKPAAPLDAVYVSELRQEMERAGLLGW